MAEEVSAAELPMIHPSHIVVLLPGSCDIATIRHRPPGSARVSCGLFHGSALPYRPSDSAAHSRRHSLCALNYHRLVRRIGFSPPLPRCDRRSLTALPHYVCYRLPSHCGSFLHAFPSVRRSLNNAVADLEFELCLSKSIVTETITSDAVNGGSIFSSPINLTRLLNVA